MSAPTWNDMRRLAVDAAEGKLDADKILAKISAFSDGETAAKVHEERERIAQAIEAEATKADESAAQPREPIFRAGDEIAAVIFRAAARIVRAES